MKEFLTSSVFFGVLLSLGAFELGRFLNKKFKIGIFNPLLIAIIVVIVVLLALHIDYDTYNAGAQYISYLLTPATVCLAIPLYEQIDKLKENFAAILAGILCGVITCLTLVLVLALLFHLDHQMYVTLLPKSITSAIALGVSEEMGGIANITVAVVIVTGVLGNMTAELVCKIFRITEPVAKGIAIGTSSHAIGTSRAMQIGEVEGAMSSLSIVVTGLLTVIGVSIYANFL